MCLNVISAVGSVLDYVLQTFPFPDWSLQPLVLDCFVLFQSDLLQRSCRRHKPIYVLMAIKEMQPQCVHNVSRKLTLLKIKTYWCLHQVHVKAKNYLETFLQNRKTNLSLKDVFPPKLQVSCLLVIKRNAIFIHFLILS